MIAGFDSIFEVQRTLYANAVQALNELQTGGAGALPSLAAAAFTFGMLHALLPGHGKSVLASYYAADGRWRGALGSSLLLILTHRTEAIRNRVASEVEVCAAIAVIAIGALPLLRQLNF